MGQEISEFKKWITEKKKETEMSNDISKETFHRMDNYSNREGYCEGLCAVQSAILSLKNKIPGNMSVSSFTSLLEAYLSEEIKSLKIKLEKELEEIRKEIEGK